MDFVKNLYRYKRLRHIAVGRLLLHDIAFSVHGLFCMEDKGLPSPGQTSSNRCRPTKLHCPTLDVSAFHLVEVLLLWLLSLGAASGARAQRCTPVSGISRREPTFVFAFEASLFAFANETPPFAFALLYPR